MHAYPLNIKCTGCLKGVLLLLSMAASWNGMAQQGNKLPDSVITSAGGSPVRADHSLETLTDSVVVSSDSQTARTTVPDTVVLRSVADTTLARYKKSKDFEYANDPAYWKTNSQRQKMPKDPPEPGEPWRLSLRMLVFIIITGSLLMLLYWQFFHKTSRKISRAAADEGAAREDEGFDGRIRDALQAKDYRLGTRYMFLKALRMLDQRQLIRYQAKATNREYVLQMSTHRAGERFRFLADAYDHVWYGDFLLDEQQFGRLSGYFEDFYRTLSQR